MPTDWILGLAGGALIGLSASLLRHGTGLTAGLSGISYSLLLPADGTRAWRALFIGGLVLGGMLAAALIGGFERVDAGQLGGFGMLAAAGLIVGIGTALGNGCTSGHGVCGVSRLSPRSLVATVVFLAVGLVTASLLRPWIVTP